MSPTPVTSIAGLQNGNIVVGGFTQPPSASGDFGGFAKVYTVQGSLVVDLKQDTKPTALLPLHDGKFALATGGDIKIFMADGSNNRTITGPSVHALTELSDEMSGNIASGSDEYIKIWDVSSGDNFRTLYGHTHNVAALTTLSDGNIARISRDDTIKIWNPTQSCESSNNCPALLNTIEGQNSSPSLTAIKNGMFAVGFSDKSIIIWNASGNKIYTMESAHSGDDCISIIDKLCPSHKSIHDWAYNICNAKLCPESTCKQPFKKGETVYYVCGNRDNEKKMCPLPTTMPCP